MKLFTNWKKKYRAAVEDRYKEQINADYFEEKRDAMRAERDQLREAYASALEGIVEAQAWAIQMRAERDEWHGESEALVVDWIDAKRWGAAWKAAAKKWFDRGEIAEGLNILYELANYAKRMSGEGWKESALEARALARRYRRESVAQGERINELETAYNVLDDYYVDAIKEIARLRAELKAYSINSRCSDCAQKSGLMYCVGCGKPFTWRNGDKRQTYKELKDDNDRLRAERDELKRRIDALDGKCGRCGRLMSEHELDDGGDLLCPQNAHERAKCYPHPADDFVFAMPDCDVCGRPYLEHGSVDENHPGPLYKTRGHTWFNPCPADEHAKTLERCTQCGKVGIAWNVTPDGALVCLDCYNKDEDDDSGPWEYVGNCRLCHKPNRDHSRYVEGKTTIIECPED